METNRVIAVLLLSLVLAKAGPLPALASEDSVVTDAGQLDKETARAVGRPPYSPYAGRSFPTRPFFGDTHLHTSFSMDAGAWGCRLSPRDAYRFAKGEEITASSGQQARLSRSLDFLVVADHSDNMGFFPDLLAGTARPIRSSRRTTSSRTSNAGTRATST